MKRKTLRSCLITNFIAAAASALAVTATVAPDLALAEGGTSTGKAEAYKYMDFQLAPRPVVGRNSKSKSKKKKAPATSQALQETAASELSISQKEKSTEVLETPATVRLSVAPVKSPIVYSAFQLGVSVQSYQPVGLGRVEGVDPYDLSALGTRPMASVDLRWLPIETSLLPNTNIGGFVSAGYAQHPVKLRTPTGTEIKNTRLQTLKAEAGFALTRHSGAHPRWGGTLLMGMGRLESIQASDSAFANNSSSLLYGSASLLAEYRWFDQWSLTGGYVNRLRLTRTSDNLDVQRHNFVIGFLGSFR